MLNVEQLEDRCVPSTITVTTRADSGAGSLRDAISKAVNGDTVNFASGLTGTFDVNSSITIDHNITIAGPGESSLALDGQGTTQVFVVQSASPQAGDLVSLSDLTIKNGFYNGAGFGGGGIEDTTTDLSLNRVAFLNCFSATYGGGVSLYVGLLKATSCDFENNKAIGGGAVFAWDTASAKLNIDGSNFLNNSATGSEGGAIGEDAHAISQNKSLIATNSTFTGNISAANGPIWANPDIQTVTETGDTFSGNSGAPPPDTSGLGVSVAANGQITYTVTSLADGGPGSLRQAVGLVNAAPETAVALEPMIEIPAGTIWLNSRIEISHNCDICGAGENLTIIDGQNKDQIWYVYFNAPSETGGDPNPNVNMVVLSDMTVRNGNATGNGVSRATEGGGVESRITPMCLERMCFENNSAVLGGAARIFSGNLAVEDCMFENNTASQHGGAIYVYDQPTTNLTLTNDTFTGHSATISGGAVFIGDHSTSVLVNGVWTSVATAPKTLAATGCTFTGNTAPAGGAIEADRFVTQTLDSTDLFTTASDTTGIF
jgi:hypothetical protein